MARTVTRSPTVTGCSKVIRSTATVTTMRPEWRIAAIPATSSQSLTIAPPWTLSPKLASVGPIHRVSTALDSDGGRNSSATGAGSLGARPKKLNLKEGPSCQASGVACRP